MRSWTDFQAWADRPQFDHHYLLYRGKDLYSLAGRLRLAALIGNGLFCGLAVAEAIPTTQDAQSSHLW